MEDEPKSGRPCISTTDANIEKVRQFVHTDHHLTIRVMANKFEMDKETVQTILVNALSMQKICAKAFDSGAENSLSECMPRHPSAARGR